MFQLAGNGEVWKGAGTTQRLILTGGGKPMFDPLDIRWPARVPQQENAPAGSPGEMGGTGETRWESVLSTSRFTRYGLISLRAKAVSAVVAVRPEASELLCDEGCRLCRTG